MDIAQLFYDSKKDGSLAERNSSKTLNLRNFNNWVKSVIINTCVSELRKEEGYNINVFDMGCGKGGDQLKWDKSRVRSVTFADISANSIEACKKRYHSSKLYYDAKFFVTDFTKELFINKLKDKKPCYDIVSSQFVIHYAFINSESANKFIRNASELLKIGGCFIVTTIDAYKLVAACQKSHNQTVGNDMFKITFDPSINIRGKGEIPVFGAKYHFTLTDLVNCPEYLVEPSALRDITSRNGLSILMYQPFNKFYEENNSSSIKFRGTLSEQDWQLINLYTLYVFKKTSNIKYE